MYNTHWKIAVIIFFILFLVTLGLAFYLFVGINKGQFFTVPDAPVVQTETFDRKSLTTVIDNFDARKTHFEEFKNHRPASVDPSL